MTPRPRVGHAAPLHSSMPRLDHPRTFVIHLCALSSNDIIPSRGHKFPRFFFLKLTRRPRGSFGQHQIASYGTFDSFFFAATLLLEPIREI